MARRARRPARRVRHLAARSSGASRRTRSPRTGATCAATPTTSARRGVTDDPATVERGDVAAYVEELRAGARRRRPRALRAVVDRPRASSRCARSTGSASRRACVDADPSEEVGAPRVPQGIPKALTEAEVEALLGAVPGDDPRALRDRAILETLYAGGLRISELVGLDRGDLDLDDGLVRVLGKGARSGSCRSGAPPAAALDDYLAARPARARAAGARARARGDAGVPQRPGRAAHPPGLLADRARRRRPGRARRPAVPARAAALVRHPHARPRRRHPGGPGAARPRQPLDHPGVHEGLAGAAPGGLRRRPPPGPDRRHRRPERAAAAGQATGSSIAPWPRRRTRCCATSSRRSGTASWRSSSELGTAPRATLDFDENFADSGQVTAERGEVERSPASSSETLQRDRGRAGQVRRRHLRRVRVAATSEIGEARLEAMPAARLCITCASQRR